MVCNNFSCQYIPLIELILRWKIKISFTPEHDKTKHAPIEDSDAPSLIRVFAVRQKNVSHNAQCEDSGQTARMRSDRTDAQADLSLAGGSSHFVNCVELRLILFTGLSKMFTSLLRKLQTQRNIAS